MEIDHVTVPVGDYDAGKRFYQRALLPLGLVIRLDWPQRRKVFFGTEREPSSLWLTESEAAGSLELAVAAPNADAVDVFHAAAVAAGGRTEYEPGIRPEYSREYYAARVIDPDGNSIEAVFRGAVARRSRSQPEANLQGRKSRTRRASVSGSSSIRLWPRPRSST